MSEVSVEGGVTGVYLTPLELFGGLRVVRLRSSMQLERERARARESTVNGVGVQELPRITYSELLRAHAGFAGNGSAITAIARVMFEELVGGRNERLRRVRDGDGDGVGTGTGEIRTFFWHTTKIHVDNGGTSIRPMIEFIYDSAGDVVRGVHVRRTKVVRRSVSTTTAGGLGVGGENGEGIDCVICEFMATKGVLGTSRREGMDEAGVV